MPDTPDDGDRYRLAIPAALQALNSWLVWRFEAAEKAGAKPLKVPYSVVTGLRRGGIQGSPEDLAQLVTFERAIGALGRGRWSGIGLAHVPGIGINSWDFDNSIDASGVISPELEELLRESGTYVEISPSGRGIRMIARGNLPSIKRIHPSGYNIECFGETGFVTITGRVLFGDDVVALPAHVEKKLREWLQADTSEQPHTRTDQLAQVRTSDPVYQALKAGTAIKRDWPDGRSSIVCPFESEHTSGSGRSDTVYFLPNTNGYAQGHFHCLHAHCAQRTDAEFRAALGVEDFDLSALLQPKTSGAQAPAQVRAPGVIIPIDWAEVGRNPPPARGWAIDGWVGFGHVTLQAGQGGVGKTLIMQQQASCLARGKPFLGAIDECYKSLVWCAEDDADELARRQLAIAEWLGVPIGTFSGWLYVHALAGIECALMTLQGGVLRPTKRANDLWQQINDYKVRVVGLDNISHLFGGNENDRHHVTSFVNMLTGMCIAANAAGILNGHPGKSQGSEYSGSTAWENAVRARLYLSRVPPGEDESKADDTSLVRYLSKRKANYSARDSKRFVYHGGTLRPDDEPIEASPLMEGIKRQKTERVVLSGVLKLKEMGVFGNSSTASSAYLPKVLIAYAMTEGLHKSEVEQAMRGLMKDGLLRIAPVGMYANRTPKMGLVVVAS